MRYLWSVRWSNNKANNKALGHYLAVSALFLSQLKGPIITGYEYEKEKS